MSAKHTFLLFAFLLYSPFILLGQSEVVPAEKKQKVKEIGLNATAFVNNFLNLSNSNVAVSPYHLSLKKIDENGRAFRFGLGLNASYSKGPPNSTQTFTEERKFFSTDTRIRMGVERQRKISKRWYFNMGFDGILRFDYSRLKNTETDGNVFKFTQRRIDLGGGPILGVQLMLTNRMGLFTESTAYLIGRSSKSKDQNDLGEDETSKSESASLNFVLPTNVYFFVRF